jgi:holo-[acyl-carrier protein] synthase
LKTALFTPDEIAYCDSKRYPERHYAARMAAREAFLKALGSGALTPGEFKLVEVVHDDQNQPYIRIYGQVEARAKKAGVTNIFLSLSHTKTTAAAVVVLDGERIKIESITQ